VALIRRNGDVFDAALGLRVIEESLRMRRDHGGGPPPARNGHRSWPTGAS
jgi:hypothetical protein